MIQARPCRPILAVAIVLAAISPFRPAYGDDPFAAGVRTTPWLKPEEEQAKFKLPPGFEIQLVAAEPHIQKPLNMAFDDRNRIWLTDSVEYPFPVPVDKPGRDTIKILEDTDGDGRYEKITTFAEGLNIPIGVFPWRDGCIAWSIPHVWHFEDADRDGRSDKRTPLYGPFDHTRDTHGNINALRRGWDGWLYSNHGFNNQSQVKGGDGNIVTLHSGNTFRMRMDGSRVEHFTHGQVNPFGAAFDPLFNQFTADCHSKPLTQLLRGGHYPSFGRPHDGLGFVPSMMEHSHGSTAICGVTLVETPNFPAEYHGQILSGNVMTCRINRNRLDRHGSTIQAIELPDFLSCDDPWFRPVDLHIGPDGALYILDFYNRIIGHYEVPLPHPGRDRTSGRIWRVVYKGDAAGTQPAKMPPPLAEMPTNQLIAACDAPTLTRRLRALELLVEHGCTSCPEEVAAALPKATTRQKPQLLWALERMGKLTSEQLAAAAGDAAEEVRVHAMKILAERPEWSEADRKLAVAGLQDDNGFVARAAADALARHPRAEFLQPILQRLSRTSDSDNHLRYVLRMAVRDHLATSDDLNAYLPKEIAPADRRVLVDLALVVKSNAAARFLARQIATESIPEATVVAICSSVAATAPTEEIVPFIRDLRQKYGPRTDFSLALIDALTTGRQKQGPQIVPELGDWALEAARQTFTSPEQAGLSWSNHAVEGKPASDDPWVVQARPSADGDTQALFFGSLPKGEQRTGINRSQPFALPETLSFYCAGHSGPPGQKKKANFIRLRDAANHELLMESPPAWNDIAQRVEWDLNKFAGRRGYVELVDADDANAYAWIAVGRFSLAGLNPNGAADARRRAVQLVGQHNLADLTQDVAAIGTHAETDRVTRQTCVQTLLKLRPRPLLAAMTPVMTDGDLAVDFAVRIARLAVQGDGAAEAKLLRDIARELPARLHTTMAENLAGDRRGALELVALVDEGRMSAHLLRSPNVNNKLKAMGDAELNALVERLVATLPPADAALDKLLADRRKLQSAAKPDMLRGQEHFKKHCAVCHQVAGQGAVIGPQLDGIGLRGVERLLEDVLDPNRNVDVAFRTTLLALADGKVVSVLVRREEGETLVAVDAQGKEVRIGKADVEKQSRSTLSLMPANVAEILPPEELPHLIGYLASLREKKE